MPLTSFGDETIVKGTENIAIPGFICVHLRFYVHGKENITNPSMKQILAD
jgi:hypothetical protein